MPGPYPDAPPTTHVATRRLRVARCPAARGRPASVAALLRHGADPARRDASGLTPLDHCRHGRVDAIDPEGHDAVEALLLAAAG